MPNKAELTIIGLETIGIATAVQTVELGLQPTIITNHQNFIPAVENALFNSILNSPQGQELWSHFKQMILSKRIEILSETSVWGIFPDTGLSLSNPDGIFHLQPQNLLIALADQQQVPVFPGWTKAGIWTADRLNDAWLQNKITLESRVLVAGSQNNLEQIAQKLTKAGVKVVAIVDSKNNQMLCGIKGQEKVEQAIICPMDNEGNPILNKKKTFDVDAVILDYGSNPCRIKSLLQKNSFLVPHLYVAFSNHFNIDAQLNEGRLLAQKIASDLGFISQPETAQYLGNNQKINHHTKADPNFAATWNEDTIICPCENINVGQLKETILQNSNLLSDINSLKRYTRVGMGQCQGRRCSYGVKHLLATTLGKRVTVEFTVQSPISAIAIGLISQDANEDYSKSDHLSPDKNASLPPS